MRPGTLLRTLAICSALVASISLAACSSDDGNGSSGQSGGNAGSTEEYCEAVREFVEIVQRLGGQEPTDEDADRFVELLTQANASAPPQVRRDVSAAFLGDSAAQESVERYNRDECGVDLSAISTTPQ